MATVTNPTKLASLKAGSILSENSFYVVKSVLPTSVVVTDDHGNEITIGNEYVDQILSSADHFSGEEKKTMTELADLFINSPRIAMTVAFYKKDKPKTKTAYKKEVATAIKKVQEAPVSQIATLLQDLIDNPITNYTPGEFRVMKGRHNGNMNDLGRMEFMDMEDKSGFVKQVDPRTIQYIIVNNIKYTLK